MDQVVRLVPGPSELLHGNQERQHATEHVFHRPPKEAGFSWNYCSAWRNIRNCDQGLVLCSGSRLGDKIYVMTQSCDLVCQMVGMPFCSPARCPRRDREDSP